MPTPVFYPSATSTTAVTTIAGTPKDSSTSFLTFYSNLQNGSYALTGTDAALFGYSNVYDSTNSRDQIVLTLSSAADHRTQSSYSFNVVATSGTLTSTIAVTGTIAVADATLTPTVSLTKETILDGDKANVTQAVDNDSSTFSLVSGFSDNSLFTIDSTTGYLSLNTYASFNSKSSYSIKVTATSGYTVSGTTSALYKDEIFAITVTDGSATFLASDNGSKQTSAYAFTVKDETTVLSDSIYVTDECLFTLSGTDSALFSITPTTSGTRGKKATLSLITAAKYQDQASYSVTVTATDAASKTSTKEVGVTVVSDTTAPTVTLSAASSSVTKTVDVNEFTVSDEFSYLDSIITITTDEPVDVTVTGTNSSSVTAKMTDTKNGKITLSSAIAKNTNTSYTFNIVATDKSTSPYNVTTTAVTLVVSDKSVPVISLSTATSALQSSYTNSKSIPIVFTSDEVLSTAFTTDVFTLANCQVDTTVTAALSTTSASFNVVPTADGTVTVKLEKSKVTGKNSGSNNASETSVSFTYDSSAPTKPSITGDNPLTIARGYIYTDVPPTLTDGSTLTTYNPVDTTTAGDYYVTYTAKDTAGNTSGAVRKVIVTSTGARSKPVIEYSSTPSSSYAIGAASSSLFTTKSIVNSVGSSITVTQSVKQSDGTTDSSFTEMGSRAGKYFVTSSGTDDLYGTLTSLVTTVIINPVISGIISTAVILANGVSPVLADFGPPVSVFNGASLTVVLTTNMTSNTTGGSYTATFTVASTSDYVTVTSTKSFIIKPVMEGLISTSSLSLANGATVTASDFSSPYATYNGSKYYATLTVARATTGTYTSGTWIATLTASGDFGIVTATKTFYIKPAFTFTGGTAKWAQYATFTQDATVVAEFNGLSLTYTSTSPDTSTIGTRTITFTSTSGDWGGSIIGTRTITVVYPNDVQGTISTAIGSVDFKLSALTGSITLANSLTIGTIGTITDTNMQYMPEVVLTMAATKWKDIFYTLPSGLENMTDLSNFNVFTAELMYFKTNSANMPTLTDISTTAVTVNILDRTDSTVTNGNMVEIATSQKISEASTKNWSYDILGKENFSEVFSNLSTVKTEIDGFLTGSGSSDLHTLLKAVILAADAKTNTNTGTDNLVRQLVLQLQQSIWETTNYSRLTNNGIFASTNKVTSGTYAGYYPFIFLAGDSLTLSLTLKATTSTTNSATQTPYVSTVTKDVSFRIKIKMT